MYVTRVHESRYNFINSIKNNELGAIHSIDLVFVINLTEHWALVLVDHFAGGRCDLRIRE